jgi:hypothetical protein
VAPGPPTGPPPKRRSAPHKAFSEPISHSSADFPECVDSADWAGRAGPLASPTAAPRPLFLIGLQLLARCLGWAVAAAGDIRSAHASGVTGREPPRSLGAPEDR